MNNKQRRTLRLLFAQPTPAGVRWPDVRSLLVALGADLQQRAGSRVAVKLNDFVIVVHEPHPSPVLMRDAVRDLRDFLEDAGVTP